MAHDQFAVGCLRINLEGSSLTIERILDGAEVSDEEARQLAQRYTDALRKYGVGVFRVIDDRELARMFPQFTMPASGPEPRRLSYGLRRARQDLLRHSDARLRQCYGYLQDATENQDAALFHLYKLIETVKRHFGSREKAAKQLGARVQIELIARLANEYQRDQRHAPDPTQPVRQVTAGEIGDALTAAREIVRAYEAHFASTTREGGE